MTDRIYEEQSRPQPHPQPQSQAQAEARPGADLVSQEPHEELGPLLNPARLIPARDILRDRKLIPDVAGIYGWWFDTPLPDVPLDGTLAIGARRLLYVGIAPRKPSAAGSVSNSTLRHRITRNHLGNRIGSSTLRRSLAALLKSELELEFLPDRDRPFMSSEHEARLSGWMDAHAAVSVLPHSSAWEVEDRLVASNTTVFPLNVRGADHSFVSQLRTLRKRQPMTAGGGVTDSV